MASTSIQANGRIWCAYLSRLSLKSKVNPLRKFCSNGKNNNNIWGMNPSGSIEFIERRQRHRQLHVICEQILFYHFFFFFAFSFYRIQNFTVNFEPSQQQQNTRTVMKIECATDKSRKHFYDAWHHYLSSMVRC